MKFTMKSAQQLLQERGCTKGNRVQMFIAQECIRRMHKYTPFDTGVLAASAQVESGGEQIRQATPYARKQYYTTNFRHRGIQTHHWFEAMKQNGGRQAILRAACQMAGAKKG